MQDSETSTREMDVELDSLDLRILSEMLLDGRQPVSDLANKLGISRTYAGIRLHRLLDRKVTRIAAFTNPLALGYNTVALTGIRVWPGEVYAVAERLRSLPEVKLVEIGVGWQDIIIWTMFANAADLSGFLVRELGAIPGISSTETMLFVEWRVSLSYLSSGQAWRKLSFCSPSTVSADRDSRGEQRSALTEQKDRGADLSIDRLDLLILKEMELDGRQSLSILAKKLGISRANASARLQRLLDKEITRVVAFTYPLYLGYHIFAMIAMRVSPKEINSVIDKFETLPNMYWLARVIGRHDVIVWMMFRGPMDLSRFLGSELGAIQGILSTDIMIGLEARKMSFAYLASSYLRSLEQRQ